MNHHVPLCILATALVLAGCDSDDGGSAAPTNPAAASLGGAFGDDAGFAYLLTTGRNSSETDAYWNCSVQGSGESVENLHVRFWQDGSGFSGPNETTWSIAGTDRVDIAYAGGSFSLLDIEFSSQVQESDIMTATDGGSGDAVYCQRFGPLRGDIAEPTFDDPTIGLLESQLLNPAGTVWQCREEDGTGMVFDVTYEFLPGTRATLDGVVGRWFVDNRFNVVLSIEGEVYVIDGILFDESDPATTRFTGALYERDLDCRLH